MGNKENVFVADPYQSCRKSLCSNPHSCVEKTKRNFSNKKKIARSFVKPSVDTFIWIVITIAVIASAMTVAFFYYYKISPCPKIQLYKVHDADRSPNASTVHPSVNEPGFTVGETAITTSH